MKLIRKILKQDVSKPTEQSQSEHTEREVKRLRERIAGLQESAFERFPLVFTMLGTFGLVAPLYGFEGVLDNVSFFADNPVAMLITGVVVLIVTGSLYRQLNN